MPDDPVLDGPISMWPKRLRALVFRDAFAFATVLAASMVCVSLLVSWQTAQFLKVQIDNHLMNDARSISAEPGPRLQSRLSLALRSDPTGRRVGAVFDSTGRKLEGNLDELPQPLPASGTMGEIEEPRTHAPPGNGRIRVGLVALNDGQKLIFGRRVDEMDQVGTIVSRTLLCAIVPIALFAVIGGWLVWRLRERRLRAVQRACRAIMGGDLRTRLPASRRTDEFRVIALTINQMLDEVERLMIELRSVGDAMAHDLRTPLTRLRSRLGRVSEAELDAKATQAALASSIGEVDQLIGMIQAVLRLGAIESGQRQTSFISVDLAPMGEAALDLYAPIADDKGLTLRGEIDRELYVLGDRELLFEAVANLLDNAVKFTPPGGSILLSLSRQANGIVILVEDDGPGIAIEEREAVLQRFYRGNPSRGVPGNGLGLSIVAAIAQLHASKLELRDGQGERGCRVSMTLMPSKNTRKGQEALHSNDVLA